MTKIAFKQKEIRLEQKKKVEKSMLKLDLNVDTIPKISSSLVQSLFKYKNNELCGNIINHKFIKQKELPPTNHHKLNLYFKFLCTGKKFSEWEPEPELTKAGKETIFYERLKNHSLNFDLIMKQYKFKIEYVNHKFTNPKYSGTADIIAKQKKDRVAIQLITTGLFNDKWSRYGWDDNTIHEKDELLIKAIHTKILAKYEWGIEDIPFYIFVFSTKNANECKVLNVNVDESTRYQHIHNLQNSKLYLDTQIKEGFKPQPDFIKCGECVINGLCMDKVNVPLIKQISI